LLRLKEQARAADCDLVLGVRCTTTTITGSITPSIEVIAYGTALRRRGADAATAPRACRRGATRLAATA
jgi:uncharacterized protein YbjQ (UPF0145 family)